MDFAALIQAFAPRALQLLARYIGALLVGLFVHLHMVITPDAAGRAGSLIGTAVGIIVCAVLDHLLHIKIREDALEVAPAADTAPVATFPNAPRIPSAAGIVPLFLACVLLGALAGCNGAATPARKSLEQAEATYTAQGNANDDAQFDAYEKSLSISRNKTITLELNAALADVKLKAAANPDKFPAADVAAETARLYALAQQRREQAATAAASFRALHNQNIVSNRVPAQKAAAALIKPPNTAAPVNLTPQIGASTGSAPQPATLIEPGQ